MKTASVRAKIDSVLFVIPKFGSYYRNQLHVGVGYLAGYLLGKGIEAHVIDMNFGYTIDDLIRKVADIHAKLVGVTLFSFKVGDAYETVDHLRELADVPVVIGGPHVSAMRKQVLLDCSAHFAINGEGELALYELIEVLESGTDDFSSVQRLIWRRNGEVVENPPGRYIKDLGELPPPAYDRFEIEKYGNFTEKVYPIITQRGCPFGCNFCSVKLSMGRNFRRRPPADVVDEMETWYNRGWRNFVIYDDCFNCNHEHAHSILDEIIARGLEITYSMDNGIRADLTDRPLLRKMKRAGLRYVSFGVEAGNDKILKVIRKTLSIEQVRRAVSLVKEVGRIEVGLTFIIGHPQETFDDFMDSYQLVESLNVDYVNFYNIVPYPGTELYQWATQDPSVNWLYDRETFLQEISYWQPTPIFETTYFPEAERIRAFNMGMELFERKREEREVRRYTAMYGTVLGRVAYKVAKHERLAALIMSLGLQHVVKSARAFAGRVRLGR